MRKRKVSFEVRRYSETSEEGIELTKKIPKQAQETASSMSASSKIWKKKRRKSERASGCREEGEEGSSRTHDVRRLSSELESDVLEVGRSSGLHDLSSDESRSGEGDLQDLHVRGDGVSDAVNGRGENA